MSFRSILNWLNDTFRPVHIEGQQSQQLPSDMTFMGGNNPATAQMAAEAMRQTHTPTQDERPK